jgi:hypothetical protein
VMATIGTVVMVEGPRQRRLIGPSTSPPTDATAQPVPSRQWKA